MKRSYWSNLVFVGAVCGALTAPAMLRAEVASRSTPVHPAAASSAAAHPATASPAETLAPAQSRVQPPSAGERRAVRAADPKAPAASSTTASKVTRNGKTGNDKTGNDKSADDTEPSACPAGMLLVEGDYCSKVEHECEKSWYDESNKKTVCERFVPHSRCVGEKAKKRFCIDKYEWPNKKGERPEVMNKFHQAEVKCAAIGKRLCTESEWTMACEGPRLLPFPYGYDRNTETCHGDVMWDSPDMHKVAQRDPAELARLWKGVRSGSQPGCVSDYGVYDMPGNTDEVVASETYSSDFRGKFDSVHTGGPWYKGVRNQCRPKIYTHDEGFYYYFLSFRCCAEPDGKSTEPRTPKQKKLKWGMERVERIAGFSQKDVQHALTLKAKQGHCDCRPRDVRCNTICGTLLGPGAKDYPKASHSKAKASAAKAAE
jgi:formylglycine-generating enzyme